MCTFSCIFISIGFASGSLNTSVTEPQSGAKQVTLTVVRSGGASGTAQVEWNATLNGRLVSGDLFLISAKLISEFSQGLSPLFSCFLSEIVFNFFMSKSFSWY